MPRTAAPSGQRPRRSTSARTGPSVSRRGGLRAVALRARLERRQRNRARRSAARRRRSVDRGRVPLPGTVRRSAPCRCSIPAAVVRDAERAGRWRAVRRHPGAAVDALRDRPRRRRGSRPGPSGCSRRASAPAVPPAQEPGARRGRSPPRDAHRPASPGGQRHARSSRASPRRARPAGSAMRIGTVGSAPMAAPAARARAPPARAAPRPTRGDVVHRALPAGKPGPGRRALEALGGLS